MMEFSSMNGPWRNDTCMGYAAIAMERAGLNRETVRKVLAEMILCFDDTSVNEAAKFYNGEAI